MFIIEIQSNTGYTTIKEIQHGLVYVFFAIFFCLTRAKKKNDNEVNEFFYIHVHIKIFQID